MMTARHLRVGYRAHDVLHDVSVDVPAGECVAVIGANGAGKTTLLCALSGLLRARAGNIVFQDERIDSTSPAQRLQRGIAHCPEGRRVFMHMSVEDNLKVGAHLCRDLALVARRVDEAYAMFPKLFARRSQMAGTLSGGEQQMLALARALMSAPSLLLLDEPSLGLAPKVVDDMFRAIVALVRQRHMSILLVEQNAAMALSISSHAYVLDHGTIALQGPSVQMREDPRVRRVYLGG